jgi:hypothetical protein
MERGRKRIEGSHNSPRLQLPRYVREQADQGVVPIEALLAQHLGVDWHLGTPSLPRVRRALVSNRCEIVRRREDEHGRAVNGWGGLFRRPALPLGQGVVRERRPFRARPWELRNVDWCLLSVSKDLDQTCQRTNVTRQFSGAVQVTLVISHEHDPDILTSLIQWIG